MNSSRRKNYKASQLRKIKEIAAVERQKLKEMYPQITDEDISKMENTFYNAMQEAAKKYKERNEGQDEPRTT